MTVLAEIYRADGINLQGRAILRTAVRGVILRGSDLLMIYSSNVGDYKFPGGGVDAGESHDQALRREVEEECGMALERVGDEIGAVIEYHFSIEKEYDVFKMTSHYYWCEVADGIGVQKLDDYERDLGFKPVWVNIEKAIRVNRAMLGSGRAPEWLRREIFMLEYLEQNFVNINSESRHAKR
ncbi:MAG: NUDIX domain-containing protein [Anaerolineales bacterium]|nr:NUDIX domain-containing protein [Anaerolineales bacterium]